MMIAQPVKDVTSTSDLRADTMFSRRRIRFLLVLFGLLIQFYSQLAQAGRTSKIEFYSFQAGDLAEAARQMQLQGPQGFAGYTNYSINYRYRTRASDSGCRMSSFTIDLDTTYTMPKWENVAAVSESDQQAWTRYYEALWLHEQNHGAIGDAAYSSLTTEFARVGRRASCSEFEGILQEIFNRIDAEGDRQNAEYDARTSHGRSEGAVLVSGPASALSSSSTPAAMVSPGQRSNNWFWWFMGLIGVLLVLKRR